MFVSPSRIKKNKILTGRTLNFETVKKTHGNIVLIPTLDKDLLINTISSKFFRPTQLMALYVPRKIKPRGKSVVTIDQKDYYADMRSKTFGRIKKGKTTMASYGGQNLVYDIFNEYITIKDALSLIRKNRALQSDLINYFDSTINKIAEDPDYENIYIVFPMEKPYENPQRTLINCIDITTVDPLALFLAGIERGLINLKSWKKVKGIFFYVPGKDVVLALDLESSDFEKEWPNFKARLKRMNSLNSGEISIDEINEEAETSYSDTEQSNEDMLDDKKEKIKQVVFSAIAKTINAKLDDFEAASPAEKDLMTSIDDTIEKYLKNPKNLNKTVNDLIDDIKRDNDVKLKAIRFIETKKASVSKADILAKGLERETELINSVQDLADESDNVPTKIEVDVPYMDPRIEESHLISFDEEYNKKQLKKDIVNVISGFSENELYPITLENLSIEDTSTFSDEIMTYDIGYKTAEGKNLSFKLDIPKFVDQRYFYLGGNRKVIKKQLIRLPIVKTKSDRVEITTNFNKMTIERTSGKISRKIAYMLKRLKEIGNNSSTIKIEYGDNSIINGKVGYSNDFEYDELSSNINIIETPKYRLLFNRDSMFQEILLYLDFDRLNIPYTYFDSERTPLGFINVGETPKELIYIEKNMMYTIDLETGKTNALDENFFDFLIKDVLKLDMSILPTIGKSFVYTTVKFLATTYPMFAVVASQNGLTDILNRYVGKDNYFKSEKQLKKNIDYVEVKFKDTYLYYKDEIKNTLLLSAIVLFDTESYNYADFDADIPYSQFFIKTLGASVGMHTRNTLRINLSVVVDPITREILRDLKQPTNIIDILLYANTLLVGNQYKPQNDMSNYRIRSNEIVADVAYSIIADAYINYQKHKINGRPMNLSIPRGALIKKLMTLENVNDKSVLNPVIECEQIAQASAKGFKGVNINDAYTLEMRSFDKSMEGFFSGNSTPYSGQAGITRAITYNPAISSLRGYLPTIDETKLSATNILSPTELLAAFTSAGADAPRQAMQVA